MGIMSDLTFDPPGPGTWRLNDLHYPRPVTRYKRDLPSSLTTEGAKRGQSKYGFLADIEVEFVNGFQYLSNQPVDGMPASESLPVTVEEIPSTPKTEFQRRVQNAQETFETRRWRKDLDRWDEEWKPDIQETNRKLQTVSPADLDDEDLLDHLEACREAVIEHGGLIFRILPCAWVPQGDFLAFLREHTDKSPAEVVPLFAGASPDSQGAVDELQTLASAVEASADARELVFSDEEDRRIINQLMALGDGVGESTEEWLGVVGFRTISGFDLDAQYALERPATLVTTLRSAIEKDLGAQRDQDKPDELDAIRQAVPPNLRDTFDERYEEARLTYRVQDERALLGSATNGLLRRALMEAGRRLADRGGLRDPEHVVDMCHEEIVSALRGESAPSAAEVASHVRYRQNHEATDAPAQLGSDQSSLPDLESLPEPAARVMQAFAARRWADDAATEPGVSEADIITGHGVSQGTVEGPARLVSGPEDFDRIQDGDILVAEITSPTFNIVLPMVGGVVTDTGGMLSHPAIVAREFDVPGVVGCEDATDRITDGDHIIVDGEEGTVRFLS